MFGGGGDLEEEELQDWRALGGTKRYGTNRPKSEKRQDDKRASEGDLDCRDVAVDLGGHGAWSMERGAEEPGQDRSQDRSKVQGAGCMGYGAWVQAFRHGRHDASACTHKDQRPWGRR